MFKFSLYIKGATVESSYTGCKKFVTQYLRTVNYCFCKDNYCNSSDQVIYNKHIIAVCAIITLLAKSMLRSW